MNAQPTQWSIERFPWRRDDEYIYQSSWMTCLLTKTGLELKMETRGWGRCWSHRRLVNGINVPRVSVGVPSGWTIGYPRADTLKPPR